MSRYVELEDYECDGCKNDGRCGGCPSNDERINEWHKKYSNDCRGRISYGFNITD